MRACAQHLLQKAKDFRKSDLIKKLLLGSLLSNDSLLDCMDLIVSRNELFPKSVCILLQPCLLQIELFRQSACVCQFLLPIAPVRPVVGNQNKDSACTYTFSRV